MKKKIGVSSLFKELWRISKGHVFACFYVICPIDARTDFELWRARTTLLLVEIDSKLREIVRIIINSKIMCKNGIFTYCIGCARKYDARGRAQIFEMLKMAWNVCKMNLSRFWAFLIFARALTRGRTRTRASGYLKIIGLKLTLIMPNMNKKWPSVMKIWP